MTAIAGEDQMSGRGVTGDGIGMREPRDLPIVRNTVLLSASQAVHSAMHTLAVAVAAITLVRVLDEAGLLGLGPAIVLAAGALAAIPAGRSMDRFGRVPVLAAGRAVGAVACGVAALGSALGSPLAVLAGLAGVGAANGANLLIRTAGGDMYPPERRARGIGLVLFGAVFGAILGPVVFSPLLAGRDLDGDVLASLWLAAGGFELVGLVLVVAVRPDPKTIATVMGHSTPDAASSAAPLCVLLRRRGVVPALVAAQASVGVMVAVMSLTGAMVVDHFHHHDHNVFPIVAVSVIGMYALVIVVGDMIDRIGRTLSLSGGLLLMGLSVSTLVWVTSVPATAAALFGLGLGWNVSYVAATAELTDRTQPWERGRLLGFNDLLSGATGAGLTLLGGLVLTTVGVTALAIGATALVVVPGLWILRRGSATHRRSVADHARHPAAIPAVVDVASLAHRPPARVTALVHDTAATAPPSRLHNHGRQGHQHMYDGQRSTP
jgi:MFS family permease